MEEQSQKKKSNKILCSLCGLSTRHVNAKCTGKHRQPSGIWESCCVCGAPVYTKRSAIGIFKHKFCTRECQKIGFKKLKMFAGENNPAYGKIYRSKTTNPEWAAKISATSKARQVNVGDKNGMKRPEARAKASKSRRERVTSDPEYKRLTAERVRAAWRDGKFDNVKVGCCKWYTHVKPDGSTCRLQGTWEVVYARVLDCLKVEYVAHKGRIPYVGADDTEHSYFPDFYVPKWDVYVDVKGAMWDDVQRDKIACIRSSNPNMKLVVFTRESFKRVGLDVDKLACDVK